MDEKKRVEKDLKKLAEIIEYFRLENLSNKYAIQVKCAKAYKEDAEYYYQKADYFSAFGCANYAYGILEGIISKEKGKTFHELK